MRKKIPYSFEQGPIRPPAEANSLLLRLTRNCPWNRCTFCPLYKKDRFSVRDSDHVIRDIDTASKFIHAIQNECGENGKLTQEIVDHIARSIQPVERSLFNAVLHWYTSGMESVFFQDANSLIVKPDYLINILRHIRKRFPFVKRITSFGRTHTILNISDDHLKEYAALGLNRIHAGLETGSDKLLSLVNKGCTKEMHIRAGTKVQKAGIELSECVLSGLGGKNLASEHALETADVINQINPPIIRFLTLVAPTGADLFIGENADEYIPASDLDIAEETKLFIENLNGVTSYVESNNVLNLLQEVEGTMPEAKEKMLDALEYFIHLPDEKRMLFQVGKRLQIFSGLKDLNDPDRLNAARAACDKYGINQNNVEEVIGEMIRRYMS